MIASESIAASGARSWSGNRQIPWRHIAIYALAAILSAWLSVAAQPTILGDDAAIGLRYAERLANGQGFTYNDHERVCGASNPLWTSLISLGPRVGINVESATRLLASLFFVTSAVLASAIGVRAGGPLTGLLVAVAIPGDVFWRAQALSGLEVPLALSLGLAAFVAAGARRDVVAGVFLGLALITKLDALALIAGIAASSWIVRRRIPFRMLGVSVLVSLPWFLFAWLYFGQPWPQSLAAKLSYGAQRPMNHLWIAEFFALDTRYALLILAVMSVIVSARTIADRRMVVVGIFGWFVVHSLAYSIMNLGDPYPWYLAIPAALCWIAAAGAAAGGTSGWKAVVSTVMILVTVQHWRPTLVEVTSPQTIHSWQFVDTNRRLAGAFIDQFAAPTEVVESAFGWVAYESHRTFIDLSGLNSRIVMAADYLVRPHEPGEGDDAAGADYKLLARFELSSQRSRPAGGYTVYGRPGSAIARSRKNEDDVDPARLKNQTLASAWQQFRDATRRAQNPIGPR